MSIVYRQQATQLVSLDLITHVTRAVFTSHVQDSTSHISLNHLFSSAQAVRSLQPLPKTIPFAILNQNSGEK